ncbi:Werner syndrome-like exonuclease [Rhynchospora pubera]|uniref:Werner syndrome-like exonuclease n=1 Tax=Rhynchospora pubera TaxID=906938 RepID=A0AAV8DYM9_9POAL|nr:Werner syndrome-like exonuclease [Rhynchospora pubera]KAJ4771363.1 Werner syndrome-like exonuclease [Rhynchospora pubera]
MGIYYDHNDSIYIVSTMEDDIKTTVTDSGEVAAEWINDILWIHRRRLHHLIVGFDIEWCPHGWHGTYGQNPPALLQLCVGRRCLVFQLIHCDYIPEELGEFLSDDRFRFLGVGIEDDVQKLWAEYGLAVDNFDDLRYLAAEATGQWEMRQWGLQNLVGEFMGVNMDKPRRVRLSDWGTYSLTEEQIEYAALDAFTSFEVGRRLVTGDY